MVTASAIYFIKLTVLPAYFLLRVPRSRLRQRCTRFPALVRASRIPPLVRFDGRPHRTDSVNHQVTVSLRGNAHNGLIDYDWPIVDRAPERNDPAAVKS